MKLLSKKSVLLAAAVITAALILTKCSPSGEYETVNAERGKLEVWSTYAGTIEAQNTRNIISRIRGAGILTEIISDGTSVTQGTPVAEFDSSRWEDDILEAEKNLLLASADYQSLVNAKIPLEIRELEAGLMAAQQQLADEQQALKDTMELREEDLVPEYEVRQIEVKVQASQSKINGLKEKITLTKQYLHPSAVQRAQASLMSASNEYVNIKKRIDNSIVRSPCSGIAVHKPTHFSGDYRSARVGDTVYYSQAFMTIADMSSLIARCNVPEQELTQIEPGAEARVRPIAFPGMQLKGQVLSVSSMAQHLPGKKEGSKFFEIVVKIDTDNPSLRSDMSAHVHILSYKADDTLLIPRSAVWWENGQTFCNTVKFGKKRETRITVGAVSDDKIEVLDGLKTGQKVAVK